MITEQNYVGRGTSATTPPQTAKNGPKNPSQTDDWQVGLLQSIINNDEARRNLFELLYNVWELHDSPNVSGFECEIFCLWVESGVDLNENRYQVRDFINNLARQARIREAYFLFSSNSGYEEAFDRKEVSHEN